MHDTVGIIPAAGLATRISPLPCSKELIPIGFQKTKDGSVRPKVVSQYLLEKFKVAGVKKVYFVLRKGKWDIPSYYGDGSLLNMSFAYLMMKLPYGVPYTVDQAYPFVRDNNIILGFPDMIYGPDDAFIQAEKIMTKKKADMILGMFPVNNKKQAMKCDMVSYNDKTLRIEKIFIKPNNSDLHFSWLFALWKPVFSQFMHEYLLQEKVHRQDDGKMKELHLGHVVQRALEEGLKIFGHIFPENNFIDIGTPEELEKANQIYKKIEY